MTYLEASEAQIARPEFAKPMLVLVVVWLFAIVLLGRAGVFHTAPSDPPALTLLAMLLPPLLFLFAMRLSWFRTHVLSINPIWLNGMQGLRILGAGFLFVAAYGHLPVIFAFFAGWGDVLVAFLAPLVVVKLAANRAFLASPRYLAFHIIGLLDFVGAVLSGLVSRGTIPFVAEPQSTAALASLPLLLIPCFAVPLWICLHIAALAQRREFMKSQRGG
ncbi:hypothetical protein C1J03_17320 [Sulfitobacter sp. SK012]|uniref:hypothetical protein n=1 Tax=Sulfitobacter sp. SK012 TaxID=1389005 RepID=UPI000E0ABCA8|nr:hypothetical protein [Sulfitobacter sp. SK012]AXI47611.1 hypothetical protein C1J03_17320 [Sulfitobacter sp. SK012]